MAVKVILTEQVAGLGKIGEEKSVAEGYARNYLIPRKLAVLASDRQGNKTAQHAGMLRQLERKKAKYQAQYEQEIADAKKLAAQIACQSLTIPVQAQEDGKLFGSVGPQQISTALKELGIEVDRQKIMMPEPIREIGTTSVEIHLNPEVSTSIKVSVVRVEA